MLKVPKQTYHCPHCDKLYRRKRECDLHIQTCRILSEEIDEKAVEIRQDTMTHQQLCDIVKVLVKEQVKLKDQVKNLQTQLATIRKKVTVEDYLAKSVHPSCDVGQFGVQLHMLDDDFMELLDGKLEDVLETIVCRAVPSVENVPLRTFSGNGGIVYCYDEKSQPNWRKMTEQDWIAFSGAVKKSLLDRLKEWTDANERRLSEDSFSLRYNTYVQKVMCCIPRIQPKLTALLCQRVRVSLNSVTTFEFKFS